MSSCWPGAAACRATRLAMGTPGSWCTSGGGAHQIVGPPGHSQVVSLLTFADGGWTTSLELPDWLPDGSYELAIECFSGLGPLDNLNRYYGPVTVGEAQTPVDPPATPEVPVPVPEPTPITPAPAVAAVAPAAFTG